jgi:hypothetical protein
MRNPLKLQIYIFKDLNLLLFSRPTNVTKVLVFFQKWPIFARLRRAWKSAVREEKTTKGWGECDGGSAGVGGIFKGQTITLTLIFSGFAP